jgi:hypothetical protein
MSCGSSSPAAPCRGFRFPAEIINQAAGCITASASACASRVNPSGAGYRGQLRDHPRVAPALRAIPIPKTLKWRGSARDPAERRASAEPIPGQPL